MRKSTALGLPGVTQPSIPEDSRDPMRDNQQVRAVEFC
jgi:hypothetical protein